MSEEQTEYNENIMRIDDTQMCCLFCGHIAQDDDPYESERIPGEESRPICPKCGNFDIGGYSNYAPCDSWPESERLMIIKLNELKKGG